MYGFQDFLDRRNLSEGFFGSNKPQPAMQKQVEAPDGSMMPEPPVGKAAISNTTRKVYNYLGNGKWEGYIKGRQGWQQGTPSTDSNWSQNTTPTQPQKSTENWWDTPAQSQQAQKQTQPTAQPAQQDAYGKELDDAQRSPRHESMVIDNYVKWWDKAGNGDAAQRNNQPHAKRLQEVLEKKYGYKIWFPEGNFLNYPEASIVVPPGTRMTQGNITKIIRPGVKDQNGHLRVPAKAIVDNQE